jgi:capsular polysaccharide biosynthesis protein
VLANPRFQKERVRWFAPRFTMTALAAYREKGGLKAMMIEDASVKLCRGPTFINPNIAPPVLKSVRVQQPGLEVVEHDNALVMAACNFVLVGDQAVHPDHHVPSRDVSMMERFGRIQIKGRTLYHDPVQDPVVIDTAASLLHQSAGNYAHFMVEALPKLILLDQIPKYRKIPLLVDGWMHANHISAIRAFMKHPRDIIQVAISQPAIVRKLIDITPPAYAPPDLRSHIERDVVEDVGHDAYTFSSTALSAVRDFAMKKNEVGRSEGDRLFLYRRTQPYGNARELVNMDRLAHIAERAGFKIIEPGSMSLPDQIGAFRDARSVIAPVGAALVNLMFARKGCRILGLSPVFEGANYYYFSGLMEALGHDLRYVIGPQTGDGASTHLYHRNYEIDRQDFYRGLQWATSGSAARSKPKEKAPPSAQLQIVVNNDEEIEERSTPRAGSGARQARPSRNLPTGV